jgi:hypothetical protein
MQKSSVDYLITMMEQPNSINPVAFGSDDEYSSHGENDLPSNVETGED